MAYKQKVDLITKLFGYNVGCCLWGCMCAYPWRGLSRGCDFSERFSELSKSLVPPHPEPFRVLESLFLGSFHHSHMTLFLRKWLRPLNERQLGVGSAVTDSCSGCALHNSGGAPHTQLHQDNLSLDPDTVPHPGYPFFLSLPFLQRR